MKFSESHVRLKLANACLRAGSQSALAEEIGVTPAAINAVIKGRKRPHPCILKYLGLKKVVLYTAERIEGEKS